MTAIPGHVTMQTKNKHDDVFRHHGIAAGRLDLEERCIWQLGMVYRGSTQAERLNMAFKFGVSGMSAGSYAGGSPELTR
jgi:hypothetical protein